MASTENSNPPQTPDRQGSTWPLLVLLVLAAATLLAIQARRPAPPSPMAGLPLPPLEVGGWLNTDKPLTAGDLRGKIVLVDFWATDCPACVRGMPDLVNVHQRFRDDGLTVVGLTPEPDDPFGRVRRYIESVPGLDFPIGYGAGFAFELLGIYATPTYVLYDRAGQSVWSGHSLSDAEDAIVAALAK